MRIGFFTDTFLPQRNGVVTSILTTGKELVKRGHEVFVFCPKSNVKESFGMQVFSYPAVTFRPYPEFKIAVPRGKDKIAKLDIVHSHSPFTMGLFGWRVSRFQKIPRTTTFHTLLSEYVRYLPVLGKKIIEKVVWGYCEVFYNRYGKIIAPSAVLKEVLRDNGIKRPISVLPTGIDTNFFKRSDKEAAREKLGLEKGEKIFLCLGRLGHEKNLDLVIKAFKNKDGKLIVAGQGPAKKKLDKLEAELDMGDKVTMVGYVPEKLKPLYFSAADAFIIASTSETQGLVVIEAMSCGCPVIGARSLAVKEIVREGKNGFLFEPGDIENLSKILENFEPTKKMLAEAIKTGKSFSVEKCVSKLERFYASL